MTKLSTRIAAVALLIDVLMLRATAFCFKTKFKKGCSLSKPYSTNHLAFFPRLPCSREPMPAGPLFSEAGRSSESVSVDEFDWDAIARDVFKTDKRPVILFDGVCNLCNGGVNFALDNDSIGSFRFASLQSTIGKSLLLRSGKKANDISSIVLVTYEAAYFKSDAVLRIASELDGNPALPIVGTAGRIVPNFLRNTIYDFVAANRYRFGESEQCRLDFGEFTDRFFEEP